MALFDFESALLSLKDLVTLLVFRGGGDQGALLVPPAPGRRHPDPVEGPGQLSPCPAPVTRIFLPVKSIAEEEEEEKDLSEVVPALEWLPE